MVSEDRRAIFSCSTGRHVQFVTEFFCRAEAVEGGVHLASPESHIATSSCRLYTGLSQSRLSCQECWSAWLSRTSFISHSSILHLLLTSLTSLPSSPQHPPLQLSSNYSTLSQHFSTQICTSFIGGGSGGARGAPAPPTGRLGGHSMYWAPPTRRPQIG